MSITSSTTCPWVPSYLSELLHPGEVIQSYVSGNDVAIWRSYSGAINAWANRCPHRGMRLSHGFVRGDMLACLYHGWHFDSGGTCKYIPAHPDLEPPETVCTDKFDCVEQDGLIWISPTENAAAPETLPSRHAIRSVTFAASKQTVTDSLMNFTPDICPGTALPAKILSNYGVALTLDGNVNLTVALQEISADETFLHILSDQPLSMDKKIGISRQFDRLRELTEAKAKVP